MNAFLRPPVWRRGVLRGSERPPAVASLPVMTRDGATCTVRQLGSGARATRCCLV